MNTRPGAGGAGERFPSAGTRPGAGGAGERFPSAGTRPGTGGAGERFPNAGTRPGAGGAGERFPNAGNRDIANRTNNFNRYDHNQINHDNWRHGDWHDHWDHGWNNHPWAWWGAGVATGVVASAIPWSWGYWGYSNPYATAPVVIDDSTVDYSQPIMSAEAAAPQSTDASAPADQPTPADVASGEFDRARDAFATGDYATALSLVNSAIAKVPNDTTLHEFRGLVLFATGQYKEAAGVIYAVLSAGPGWDWTTLSSLYPSIDVYTKQLRALEAYRNEHPDAADARFLLAYEYLTCGRTEAAATELKAAVRLNSQDQLSAQLLAGITAPTDAATPAPAPKPDPAPAPSKPVNAASVAGKWTASRPDGSSIALDLSKDAKFTWKFSKQKQAHDFDGTYSVADNLLILNQNDNPAMVGQITQFDGRSFNFRLPGSPTGDPGLTFKR